MQLPAPQLPLLEVELHRDRRRISDLAALPPHVLDLGEHEHALSRDVHLLDLVTPLEVLVGPARPVARPLRAPAHAAGGVNLDLGVQQARELVDVAVAESVEDMPGDSGARLGPPGVPTAAVRALAHRRIGFTIPRSRR